MLNFQTILESKRQEIRSRRRDLTIESAPDDHDFAQMIAQNNNTALAIERDRRELKSIEAALRRIKAGTFGECTDCEGPIPEKRLQARPSAERCLGCQAKLESRELQEAM
jgi:DnaK suppressor protein